MKVRIDSFNVSLCGLMTEGFCLARCAMTTVRCGVKGTTGPACVNEEATV